MQKKGKLDNKSVNQNILNNNSNGSDSDCINSDKIDIKEENSKLFIYRPIYYNRFEKENKLTQYFQLKGNDFNQKNNKCDNRSK